MIVLFGGEKGGTGKTTLATNIAAMRARAGRDVLLVDTDPQGSASYWVQTRDEAGTTPRVANVQKFGKNLSNELADLAGRYQDIIIDAGGRDSPELRSALVRTELAIIPVQASQFDLWTLDRMDTLVKQAQGFNPGLRVKILISMASTNPGVAESQSAAELVGDFDTFELADTIVRSRIAFRRAAAEGKGVVEMYDEETEKAVWEMNKLYKEIYQ